MPYNRTFKPKKWTNRYTKAKAYQNKARKAAIAKKRVNVNFVRGPSGLADKTMVKLKYCDSYNLASTSGSLASRQFMLNSVFDPDYTGGGHQPLYYDNYAALYQKYRVHAYKIKISCIGISTTVPTVVTWKTNDSSDVPANSFSEMVESNRSKYCILSGFEGQNRGFIRQYQKIATIMGLKRLGQERDYTASTGASPSEAVYGTVLCQPMNAASTCQVQIVVELTQYVEFYSRKAQDQN